MHDDGILFRHGDDLAIHLIILKSFKSLRRVPLLPHTCPNIGVYCIGTVQRFFDGMRHSDSRTVPPDSRLDIFIWLITFGTRNGEGEWNLFGSLHPRVHHVVAVTHKSNFEPIQISFVLHQRQTVSQNLTWVVKVRESVDHRYRGEASHLF